MMRTRIAVIIALLFLTGCERTHQTVRLDVEPADILVSKDGGTFDIKVNGEADWVTDNTAHWISIRKDGGNASVIIDPNPGHKRVRTINFRSGQSVAHLHITQEHSDILSVSETQFHSGYRGAIFKADIECYENWTAASSCGWIEVSPEEGTGPESVTISVSQSFEKEERNGTVIFKSGERTTGITVTQGPSPYIALEKDEVHIDGDGGVIHVLYLSNTEVSITTDDPWIRMIDIGTDEKKIAFEVLRNTAEARTGHVTVTSIVDTDYHKTLTVSQGEKIDHPAMWFEEGYLMDISEKGTYILHPVFEDMEDTRLIWSSDRQDIASVNQEGCVIVHTGGECTISARNTIHEVSASISLRIRLRATGLHIRLGDQDMEANPLAVRFPGESNPIRITMSPEDAYSGDVVCLSSDTYVASVDGMNIRFMNPGSATISVESLYQGIRKTFDILVLDNGTNAD